MSDPIPRAVSAIFPDDSAMWRAAEGLLRRHLPPDRLSVSFAAADAQLPQAEIVLAFALGEDQARKATGLRWIQSLGSGTDALAAAAKASGALLTNARGLHAAPVSEAVMAAMLGLARGMKAQVREQDAARWTPRSARLLVNARAGIVGTGEIARAVALKARAFGMHVTGFSAAPRLLAAFDDVLSRDALVGAAGEFDHIVLLAALDDSTRHIASAPLFAAMKESAYLLNFGRGDLVDEAALIAALNDRWIAGAALDTFATEPLPGGHPFWTLPGVLLTPHSAGRHFGYVADVIALFLDNLSSYEAGDVAGMRNRVG